MYLIYLQSFQKQNHSLFKLALNDKKKNSSFKHKISFDQKDREKPKIFPIKKKK